MITLKQARDIAATPSAVGVPTGFETLDKATGGLVPGRLWVVTSAPGHGRSTLATQWALALAAAGLECHLLAAADPDELLARRVVRLLGRDEGDMPLLLAGTDTMSLVDTDHPVPPAIVVDDAERGPGSSHERLRSWAAAGSVVIVTAERSQVLDAHGVTPAWATVADVVMEAFRPDIATDGSGRPGEVDVLLHRNRWGGLACARAFAIEPGPRFVAASP